METEKDSKAGKIASRMIVAMVLAGMLLLPYIADIGEGSNVMARLFIGFLGAIIVVQLIPGMILVGAMLKGVLGLFGRKDVVHRD